MNWNQRQKMSFHCTLSHFMATYCNSLCRYCQLWALFLSPQLKNWFFEVKRFQHRFKDVNKLNIVLLYAFCSDEFKYIKQVICTERHMKMVYDEDCQW